MDGSYLRNSFISRRGTFKEFLKVLLTIIPSPMSQSMTISPEIWRLLRPQEHFLAFISNGVRLDGRNFFQRRPLHVKKNILSLDRNPCLIGSAQVQLGGTMVLAAVRVMIIKYASSEISTLDANSTLRKQAANQGDIVCSMNLDHLLPGRSGESKDPDPHTVEIKHIIESLLNKGNVINKQDLVIEKDLYAYRLCVDLTPLSDEGNLKDAALYAAITALSCSLIPKAIVGEEVQINTDDRKLLSIIPLVPISFAVLEGGEVLWDPSRTEQQLLSSLPSAGLSTVVIDSLGESMHYMSLEGIEIDKAWEVAKAALAQQQDFLASLQTSV